MKKKSPKAQTPDMIARLMTRCARLESWYQRLTLADNKRLAEMNDNIEALQQGMWTGTQVAALAEKYESRLVALEATVKRLQDHHRQQNDWGAKVDGTLQNICQGIADNAETARADRERVAVLKHLVEILHAPRIRVLEEKSLEFKTYLAEANTRIFDSTHKVIRELEARLVALESSLKTTNTRAENAQSQALNAQQRINYEGNLRRELVDELQERLAAMEKSLPKPTPTETNSARQYADFAFETPLTASEVASLRKCVGMKITHIHLQEISNLIVITFERPPCTPAPNPQ